MNKILPGCRWDLAECGCDVTELWTRSSLVVRESDCHYRFRRRNSPGFNPNILRHSTIWRAKQEAMLNIVRTRNQTKNSCKERYFCRGAWQWGGLNSLCGTYNGLRTVWHSTENSKQIFPEKELRGLSPNFRICVSVSDLYIPMISLPILLQENMWTDPGNI